MTNTPSRNEVLAEVEGKADPTRRVVVLRNGARVIVERASATPAGWEEQELLQILARVHEEHEAGVFATMPHVCLLLRRLPRVLEELMALRLDNARLRGEASVAAAHEGLFSIQPNSIPPKRP